MPQYYKVCDSHGRTRDGSFQFNLEMGEITCDLNVGEKTPIIPCERGLHFTTREYVGFWASWLEYTHVFEVAPVGDVKEDGGKLVCTSLRTVGPLHSVSDFVNEEMSADERLEMVRQYGTALMFVKEQTKAICLVAVQGNGWAIQFVKEQTEAICLAAVQKNGMVLEYVENQTEEICLAAVLQIGRVLRFVKEQTEAICLAAVRQNGVALKYVKEQTEAICLAAVQQNGLALEVV